MSFVAWFSLSHRYRNRHTHMLLLILLPTRVQNCHRFREWFELEARIKIISVTWHCSIIIVPFCVAFALEYTSPEPNPVMLSAMQVFFRGKHRDFPIHVSAGRQWISKAGQHGEWGSKETKWIFFQRITSLCLALPHCWQTGRIFSHGGSRES